MKRFSTTIGQVREFTGWKKLWKDRDYELRVSDYPDRREVIITEDGCVTRPDEPPGWGDIVPSRPNKDKEGWMIFIQRLAEKSGGWQEPPKPAEQSRDDDLGAWLGIND